MAPLFAQLPSQLPVSGTDLLRLLPELFALVGLALALLADASFGKRYPRIASWVGGVALLLGLVVVVLHLGAFPARAFGGLVYQQPATDFLRAVTLGAVLWVLLWQREKGAEFVLLALGMAFSGLLLMQAQNLVLLYVALEGVSITSYALVAYRRDQPLAAEAGVKYVIYGGVASGLMLYGMSLLFGIAGTLGLGDPALAEALVAAPTAQAAVAAGLVLVGLLFKLAAAPLQFWAPDVYTTAPTASVALIATVPKLAAVGALLQLSFVFATALGGVWQLLIAASLLLSLVLGNLLALRQQHFLRLLAYSSIGQVGFLLIGPLVGTPEAWAAAVYYVGLYALFNLLLTAALAWLETTGGRTRLFSNWQGPAPFWVWLALGVGLVGLTGLPPTAGFPGKLNLFLPLWGAYQTNLLDVGWLFLLVLISAVVFTVVSLAYYLRPLLALLGKPADAAASQPQRLSFTWVVVLVVPVVLGLLLGVVFFDRLLAGIGQGVAS